jgi:hypothetical protein
VDTARNLLFDRHHWAASTGDHDRRGGHVVQHDLPRCSASQQYASSGRIRQVLPLGLVGLYLPPPSDWTQTLSVLGSVNGSTYTTLVASENYTFNPATGNTVSFNLPAGTSEQYLQLVFTASTGWAAASSPNSKSFPEPRARRPRLPMVELRRLFRARCWR